MGHAPLEHLKASPPLRMDLNLDRRGPSRPLEANLVHDQETPHAHGAVISSASRLAADIERIHDLRLVRSPQIHRPTPLDCGAGELVHRLHRILSGGAGEPIGSFVYTPAQLKTMQEIITLVVFAAFSVLYLKASFTLNHLIGFALIAAGAFFVFKAPI